MLSSAGSMLNRTALWIGRRSAAAARSASPEADVVARDVAARKVRRVIANSFYTVGIQHSETAYRRVFRIQIIFQRQLAQADLREVTQLFPAKRPRHFAAWIGFI